MFDLSKIKVFTLKNKFLCEAHRVTLTHPLAEHLGTINDMEDFKQKIQKPKQLRKKTIKAVKDYLSKEDVDILEQELEAIDLEKFKTQDNQKSLEVKENKLISANIAEEQSVKPAPSFFNNSYERFDYLKTKENLSEEETAWITWYKTTEEYKEIYL